MAYVRKTFSCPPAIWDDFQTYLDEHPEVSYSGILQKLIKNFMKETKETPIHVHPHTQ
jgi:hypothetical protein